MVDLMWFLYKVQFVLTATILVAIGATLVGLWNSRQARTTGNYVYRYHALMFYISALIIIKTGEFIAQLV